ncbi:MAG: XTP/dITP diphosphohydrolase [Sphingomonadales bacterium]|jgi:XTP/dITP diphosphohydrolase|nr:XTP/dITP diphosphohydrolase [Sphingomonadales bacterium]
MERIAICTSNRGKIREFERMLKRELDPIALAIDEVQALDTESVCRAKAGAAYGLIGRPVLVDDTGFELPALGKFPGALVTWVIESGGTSMLHRMLPPGVPPRAVAVTSIGFADCRGVNVFTGRVEGDVVPEPRGTNGFGFDDVFVPQGTQSTFAEMSDVEKDAISPRRIALDALRAHLDKI